MEVFTQPFSLNYHQLILNALNDGKYSSRERDYPPAKYSAPCQHTGLAGPQPLQWQGVSAIPEQPLLLSQTAIGRKWEGHNLSK